MTPPDTKTLPLLTDERIERKATEYIEPYAAEVRRTAQWARDFYETARKEDAAKIARLEGLVQELVDRLGDGETAPKVWTEEDVKALLRDFYAAAMDGPYLPNITRMDEFLAKHGFTL